MISVDMPPQTPPAVYDASPQTEGQAYDGPPVIVAQPPPPKFSAVVGPNPNLDWVSVGFTSIEYWPRGQSNQIEVTLRCRLARRSFENCRPHASTFASRIFYDKVIGTVENSRFRPVSDASLLGRDFLVTTTVVRVGG